MRAIKAIKKALHHKGFSLVEMVCACPTNFGRKALASGDPIKGLKWIKECSVTSKEGEKLSEKELSKRFVLGDFSERHEPVFDGSSVYCWQGGA